MLPARPAKSRVFLSHSDKNRGFVVRLARVLDRHKISYWYSARHIKGAKQWHDEIGRALTECNWFLVVLTPSAVRSQWVKRELLFALDEDRYNKRIIPLLCKPCKYSRLSWTLSGFQLVDFTRTFDMGCRQLLRIWDIGYEPEPLVRGAKGERKQAGRSQRRKKS